MRLPRKPSADRRAEIVEATCALLLEKGVSATTTRDVTGRIGAGVGLLAHYFSWADLRATAVERVLLADLAIGLPETSPVDPMTGIERFLAHAFAARAVSVWRIWIEGMDAARSDPALASVLRECTTTLQNRLEALITAGHDAQVWRCDDPAGATLRIMAVHDGLAGFILTGTPRLDRRAARTHLRVAVGHECAGIDAQSQPFERK
jgi:AcrR family transcriptional regulator